MLVDRHVREQARAAHHTLSTLSRLSGGLAAACGMGAPSYPQFAGLGAALAFVAFLANDAAESKRRLAEDPLDEDYRTRTTMNGRRIQESWLLYGLEAPPSGARESLVHLGTSLTNDADAERAMVRAFERAAGAFKARDEGAAHARLREQRRYARFSVQSLHSVGEFAAQAGGGLEAEPLLIETTAPSGSGRLDKLLPDDVLAALYRAGIRISELRSREFSFGAETRSQLITTLNDLPPKLSELAAAIEEWDAESGARAADQGEDDRSHFVISERDGVFEWRLIDPSGRTVTSSGPRFTSRSAAMEDARRLLESVPGAWLSDE